MSLLKKIKDSLPADTNAEKLLSEAVKCHSAEDIIELAKSNNISINLDDAKKVVEELKNVDVKAIFAGDKKLGIPGACINLSSGGSSAPGC